MCYLIYHTTECKKCGESIYHCKCEEDEWFAVADKMKEDIDESKRQRHNSNS